MAAAFGLYLSGVIVGGGGHDSSRAAAAPRPDAAGAYSTGVAIPTSFGSIAIDTVDGFGGPTAQDLGGQVHGVNDLVAPDRSQLQVAFTLTNQGDDPVSYNSRQFRILSYRAGGNGATGSGQRSVQTDARPIASRAGSVDRGELLPGASIAAEVSFVVPRRGEKLKLRYSGAAEPVLIDLGKARSTPQGALAQNPFHPSH